jgi:hypothetical protein
MSERCYGENQISYVVVNRNNKDRLEIFVFHENKGFTKVIKHNMGNPRYFLRYKNCENQLRARRYLARLVFDYRSYFERGDVDFTFVEFK